MTRRLYAPVHRHLSPEDSLAIARKIAHGYETMKDNPQILELAERIKEYQALLDSFGLSDHQAKTVGRNPYDAFFRLVFQLIILIISLVLSLPGIIIFSPIFFITSWVSRMKAREALAGSSVKLKGTDVIATWKLLSALVVIPCCFLVYLVI